MSSCELYTLCKGFGLLKFFQVAKNLVITLKMVESGSPPLYITVYFLFKLSFRQCIEAICQDNLYQLCENAELQYTLSHLKSFIEAAVPPIRLSLIINMMPLKRCLAKENYLIAL